MLLWRIYCKVILMVKYKYTYFGIQLSFKNHSTIINYFSTGAFPKVFRFLFSFYFNQLFFGTQGVHSDKCTNVSSLIFYGTYVISKLQYKQWNIFDFFWYLRIIFVETLQCLYTRSYSFTGTVFNHTFLVQ